MKFLIFWQYWVPKKTMIVQINMLDILSFRSNLSNKYLTFSPLFLRQCGHIWRLSRRFHACCDLRYLSLGGLCSRNRQDRTGTDRKTATIQQPFRQGKQWRQFGNNKTTIQCWKTSGWLHTDYPRENNFSMINLKSWNYNFQLNLPFYWICQRQNTND